MYINHINSYASAQDIQDALNAGSLAKPYVALNASAGTLDWNSKSPAAPVSYMGTWTEGAGTTESPYVFNITELDTDYWGDWVNIGTIKDAYYQGAGPDDLGVMLRYVDADDNWEISIGANGGGSDDWHDTFSEAKVVESEVQVGDSSDDAIQIYFDGTDQFNFNVGTVPSETLTISTINPEYPEEVDDLEASAPSMP